MRKENRKEALNTMPQDFDREALWKAIDVPKKKRKNRMFFWIFIVGMFLIGLLVVLPIKETTTASSSVSNQDDVRKSLEDEKKVDPLVNQNSIGQDGQAIENKMTNLSQAKEGKSGDSGTREDVLEKRNRAYATSKTLNEYSGPTQVTYEKKNARNIALNKKGIPAKVFTEKINNNFSVNESTTFTEIEKRATEGTDIEYMGKGDEMAPILLNSRVLSIEQIANSFIAELEFERSMSNLVIHGESKQAKSRDKIEGIGFSLNGILGMANHAFENTIALFDQNEQENALESFGASAFVHYTKKGFDFYSGLSRVQHNTQLQFSAKQSLYENSLSGPIENRITTNYILYNSYIEFDAVVGIGYRLMLGEKWTFKPTVQANMPIKTSAKGEIYKADNALKFGVSECCTNPSWSFQAGLGIHRRIGNQWEVGFEGLIRSSSVAHSLEGDEHSLGMKGVRLNVFRIL